MKKIKLTNKEISLIEEIKYGFSSGIYDQTDLPHFAKDLSIPLNEMKRIVGSTDPTIDEEAMQAALNELNEMTRQRMRENTKEILTSEKAQCVYEEWLKEGYLTEETCNLDIVMEMMRDDDLCEEMYEACMRTEGCHEKQGSWMKTRAGANGKVYESENQEEPIDGIRSDDLEDDELVDDENPKDVIKLDVPLLLRLLEFSRENAETDIDLHVLADNLNNLMVEDPDRVLTIEDYEIIMQDLLDSEKSGEGETKDDETTALDDEPSDNEVEPIFESQLPNFAPKMGSNIDHENAKNAGETLKTAVADVKLQSKTQEEKIENLHNQKYAIEKDPQAVVQTLKGRSPADAKPDLKNDKFEKRTNLEIKTGDSVERDEDVVGDKANVGDAKAYTITPDGKDVGDSLDGGEEEVKKRAARKKIDNYESEPLRVKNLSEADKKIERIKELYSFDGGKLNEGKNKINVDKDFTEMYKHLKKLQSK